MCFFKSPSIKQTKAPEPTPILPPDEAVKPMAFAEDTADKSVKGVKSLVVKRTKNYGSALVIPK